MGEKELGVLSWRGSRARGAENKKIPSTSGRTTRFEEEGITMPQALLPLVPAGATAINDFFSVVREDGQWAYFLGVRPVFQHGEDDQHSFRMFTAQLICQGSCRQSEIVRTFGV